MRPDSSRQNALLVALAVTVAACTGAGDPSTVVEPTTGGIETTTTTTAPSSTTTTVATTTTTTTNAGSLVPGLRVDWVPIDPAGEPKAVVTPTGIVLPVVGRDGDFYVVTTPCANQATVAGSPITGANVVIDPGHGGEEPGAVGPEHGLAEKDLNFAIAEEVKALLEAAGATVVLTRTADYRITLATRGEIATNLAPQAFVSIHHNADPDEVRATPGTETYYQIASEDSKRLSGLVYEETFQAFAPYGDIGWVSDTDAGAKYRLTDSGGDYYGILKRTAGVPAVLSEAAFISNPAEEALLLTPEFRTAEARAIARAVVRFLGTADPGSGYVEPYPGLSRRDQAAAPPGARTPPSADTARRSRSRPGGTRRAR